MGGSDVFEVAARRSGVFASAKKAPVTRKYKLTRVKGWRLVY